MRTRTARWSLSAAVLIGAGLALTACAPNNATSAAASSTSSPVPTSSTQPSTQPIAKTSQDTATPSDTPTNAGVSCTDQINYAGDPRSNAEINSLGEQTGQCPPVSAPTGSSVANAGDHSTIVGTLQYLAPGKLIVTPQSGGTDQAFLVSNATQILGAAAICSDDPGSVAIGNDGYGTSTCTVDQLETAAKTDSVTVRVTMNPQSGGAETVEEQYHP